MLVQTLVENSFQAVIAVDAVQTCRVVGGWDMAEAILVEYESVGERQSDRRNFGDMVRSDLVVGDMVCFDLVVEDIDWLRK